LDKLDKEVLEFLEFIGIKGYEGRAYIALLSLGEATAPQLSSKARIPLTRIYDVLDSLASKGLVEVKAGRPRVYKAIPPRIALNYYVRKYIDNILSLNRRVIDELNRLYGSSKSEEPFIWLSSSQEMSIERTKDLLENMKVDGFMSISEVLLEKLTNTLYKKLLSDPSVVFTITLTFSPLGSKALEQLLGLDNIDIRVHPTGIINAIEVDLSNAAIFGKTYTLFTNEWELILLLNESYYHGYWKNAKRIKEFNIKPNRRYKTSHHWLSIVLINDGLKHGYNAWVKVKGFRVRDKEPINIEGYVKEVRTDDVIRNLIVETEEGKKVVIGGLGASIEDIEAKYIEVVFS